MKIRDGHVSNSSSSSFVVAFPHEPKSQSDVHQFMFYGKEGGVGTDFYDEGMSYRQVAERVWEDIKMKNAQKGNLKNIVEQFSSRYHFSPNRHGGGTFYWGGSVDSDGGSWNEKRDRYFGFSEKLLEEFKQCCIDYENEEAEHEATERRFLAKLGPPPRYAYDGGTDHLTKKPFTKAEVAAHEAYQKKVKDFKMSDAKYKAFDKERQIARRKKWDQKDEMRKKLAIVDAKNFIQDNKGKFLFIVSYADDGGEGILEHGRIFRNVPHVVVNHH